MKKYEYYKYRSDEKDNTAYGIIRKSKNNCEFFVDNKWIPTKLTDGDKPITTDEAFILMI